MPRIQFVLVVVATLTIGAQPTRGQDATTTGPTSVPSPTPTTAGMRSAKLVFGGDILTHMNVVRTACQPKKECDFTRLLAPTRPVVEAADLAICHLEVPIVRPKEVISGYPTFGAPWKLAKDLAATGWDHCSTASNHSIDRGTAGVISTIDALSEAGITHAGSARTAEEARLIPVKVVNGIRIAHLAATYGLNGLRLPQGQGWRVNRIDPKRLIASAQAARAGGVDVVIVSLHWGNEYRNAPTPDQRRIARILMTSGEIDLIAGHHAHVVQPIEQVNGRWVIFGMGNHLSGQVPIGPKLGTQDGILVEVDITEDPDGRFIVAPPKVHPTWNNPATKIAYLIENVSAQNKVARASAARTKKIVG